MTEARSTVASSRRPTWLPRTLTARLVLGVVLVVVVVVTTTGALTTVLLGRFLHERLDQQLLSTATDAQVTGLLNAEDSPQQAPPLTPPQHVYVVVLDRSGAALQLPSGARNLENLELDASQRQSVVAKETGPRSMTTTGGERVRLVSLPNKTLRVGTVRVEPVTVVVALSEHEVGVTMHRVLLLELAIGGAAVVLAFGVTAAGLSWSLKPLRRVTRTAQEVTAELSPDGAGLQRRVLSTESTTEVGQLAQSFNTMLDEVQGQFAARRESENRMRQFLADASHELRTPLTSIRGYAELARLRGSPDIDDTIGRIETEGTRMSRLVEDLLLLARGDDADGTEQPVQQSLIDVGELVEDAVEGVRAAYPDRAITVETVGAPGVVGDPDQLVRVIRNLVINAAVHTNPDGPIRVDARRDDQWVFVRIADAGPGLPAEELPHVFERFWRADKARTRARGGSGLGLAIVAQIVHAHGGDAVFESSPEAGTTVTLRLPAT
ncbi:MAG: sensor histidine kinase [Jatrophihabitans sp.]